MEKQWDYVIIGAGIIGCATAYHLIRAHPDAKILLVEKNTTSGQGNTVRSMACYRNVFDTSTNIFLASSTLNYYRHVAQNEGIDLGQNEIGYLFLLSNNQYEEYNKPSINFKGKKLSLFDFMEQNQIGFNKFSKTELTQNIPFLKLNPKGEIPEIINALPIEQAFLGKECGFLSPDLIVKHYEKKYRVSGGKVSFNTIVKKLLVKPVNSEFEKEYEPVVWNQHEIGAIQVEKDDSKQIITAKKFIVTTGAWINELLDPLGYRSGVKAKKRQMFTIDNMDKLVNAPGFNEDQVLPLTIFPSGLYIKALKEAGSLVVGISDNVQRAFETTYISNNIGKNSLLDDPQGEIDFFTNNILPILQSYFPDQFEGNLKVTKSAGHYSYSIDNYPVIDIIQDLPNLFFASGASGSGISKADAIARILTALVNGDLEAELFSGMRLKVSDFSLRKRNLPHETLVL
ncbi:MAG: NAD(P)/FAD-dependent oxidoreductase [Candidatus Kariarchaeaceae archaeon]